MVQPQKHTNLDMDGELCKVQQMDIQLTETCVAMGNQA